MLTTAANKPAEAQTQQTQRQNTLFETWSYGAKSDVSQKKIFSIEEMYALSIYKSGPELFSI